MVIQAFQSKPQELYSHIVRRAVVVGATEAAAFLVRPRMSRNQLTTLLHVRPEAADTDVRRAAIVAFAEIADRCVKRGNDAAVEVRGSSSANGTQFCLTTLERSGRRVVAAATYIVRCESADAAASLLRRLQDAEEECEGTGR